MDNRGGEKSSDYTYVDVNLYNIEDNLETYL